MKCIKVCVAVFLFALVGRTVVVAQDPVMIQGFYWNVTPGGVWYDTLQARAQQLRKAGFTSIWYPPLCKGDAGTGDVGYTPYDYYDLGEYDSRGGNVSSGTGADVPTRYGVFSKLQSSINQYHNAGMQVYADMVLNHRQGGQQESNPYLSLAGSCPPAGSGGGQTYTAFPLTYGSHRIAWPAGQGAQFFYPNASVNTGNTGDYCGPQFGSMYFYTNSFGQDNALHNNVGATLPMGDSLMQWGEWLTNRLGLDGYRLDNVKGIHHDYIRNWGNRPAMAGKFIVGECYDGDRGVLQGWLSRVNRSNTSVFDFSLRWDGLKPMCDNDGTFDMRSLHTVGLMNNGTSSTQVVTFAENHDFDRTEWDGQVHTSGHNPIYNHKKLAYAYILTHTGYPCVWWRDYFNYGNLRDDINKLLGVRRWARGSQDYPTSYTGGDLPVYPDANPSKIYVMRRYGAGQPDTSGILLMLNNSSTQTSIWVTAFNWQNKTLKDISGNTAGTTTVAANGRVLLQAPAYGYAVWVPNTFPDPYSTNIAAGRIDIPPVVLQTQIIPRAVFVNLSTLAQSNIQTTLTISIGATQVYSQSQTITNFPAGDSIEVSYPIFTTTNNTTYTVVASAAPIPGTPSNDDQVQSTFVTNYPAVPTIDGDLSDAPYITLAIKANANAGFSGMDVSKIVYYPDMANAQLYIGVVGKMSPASADGIGLWLNFTELTGTSAGTNLGGVAGAGHYMGVTAPNNDYKADFEVDYMFAMNSGYSASDVYVDAVKRVGGTSASYLGDCGGGGLAHTGPSSSGAFSANSVSFAFKNDSVANHGFEMRIPFSELGITSAGNMQAFGFVVSVTAYFSDISVPGNIVTGNPGNHANYGTLAGAPFHSTATPLPVQLASFTATATGTGQVRLNWMTVSEINNYGFYVQRKRPADQEFADVPNSFIAGHGTTIQPHTYAFLDANLPAVHLVYRLKQIDLDGTVHFSSEVVVNALTAVGGAHIPSVFALHQNYPNPFNPSTRIQYDLPKAARVKLIVVNSLGQVVKTLIDEEQDAGFYDTPLDAANLASGVYFYRIEAGNYISTRKLILLK